VCAQVVLPEIHKTFELPAGTAEAREKQAEVQGQLCGVLQVIMQKLSEEEGTKPAIIGCADQVRGRAGTRGGAVPTRGRAGTRGVVGQGGVERRGRAGRLLARGTGSE